MHGIFQHQRMCPIRECPRKLDGDLRPGRRTIYKGLLQAQCVQQCGHPVRVLHQRLSRVRQRIGAAVTGRIRRNDGEVLASEIDHRHEKGGRHRRGVQHQQRLSRTGPAQVRLYHATLNGRVDVAFSNHSPRQPGFIRFSGST